MNGLVLNPKKCKNMVIGSPQRLNYVKFGTLMLNGVAIKRVQTLKYLGIIIVLDSNVLVKVTIRSPQESVSLNA